MNQKFSSYPESSDTPYYIEFSQWDGRKELWQLFRRNRQAFAVGPLNPKGEVHPWNLGEGEVLADDSLVSMHTRPFLKFMVDSLNANAGKEPGALPVSQDMNKVLAQGRRH